MDSENLLSLNKVSKKIGTFNVTNVTLSVLRGEILGIVGENGSGKTTLLNIISGLFKIDSGSININTENIGVAFDDIPFPKKLTIYEISLIFEKMIPNWKKQDFFSYVSLFKLPTRKPIGQLSKGMKMQLSLAVTLSHDAVLLIFDEITSGLDPIVRKTVLEEIDSYVSKKKAAAIMTTHNLADVSQICNRLLLLDNGKKILEKDILNNDTATTLESDFVKAIQDFGSDLT